MSMQGTNRYKRLISNTAIFAVGTFASKLMVYLLMPLYTHCLSPEESSVSDLITSTANLLMPLATIGIIDGIFRFALDAGEKKKQVFSTGMAILCAGSVGFLLLSPILFLLDFVDGYSFLIVVYVLSANYQYACASYVRALGHTKVYALQGIINTALTIVFNVIFLVFFKMGILGYVLSVVIANVIVTVILFVWMKLYRDLSISCVDKQTAKDLLKYSIPLIPTQTMWFLTSLTDRLLVKNYCGDAINGLFVYSYKIPTVLSLLTTIFIEAWQFSAVNDADENDRGQFFGNVFKSYMGLIFMAASGLVAFTKIFTRILLADSYYGAWEYMPTLIIATVFSALATFMGSVYLVEKKSVLSFLTTLTGAVINMGLSWALAPYAGVQGVAFATIMSYLAVFIIRIVNARRYVSFGVHPLQLTVNTALISAQSVLMICEVPGWIFWQIGFMAVILAFNGKPIIDGVTLAIRNKFSGADTKNIG